MSLRNESLEKFMKRKTNPGTLGAFLFFVAILVLAPGAWAQNRYKVLHKFTGEDGSTPVAGPIFDQAGNLYGATAYGGAQDGGTVFALSPNQNGGWTESVLYSFCSLANCADGSEPFTGLISDQAGNLYGTAYSGGTNQGGVVFELSPNQNGGWTESVLHSFCSLSGCTDGAGPDGSLMFDQAGNLYGTTAGGGSNYLWGTVFQLTPNHSGGWTESVLHSFCSPSFCTDGYNPVGSVTFDEAGNLYGATVFGGAHDSGTVFQLTPNRNGRWTESVLYSFCAVARCADGADPGGSLIFDGIGNLYGVTAAGGGSDNGTVFRLIPHKRGGWTESVIHNLCSIANCPDGAGPKAPLSLDGAGNLYGIATAGGYRGWGVVFRMAPKAGRRWSYKVLHNFLDKPGARPQGLILGKAGDLYGTTAGDGSTTFGSVFEVTP
jgi:uncharacterized repeat protein (TIGR03803 family)